MTEQPPRGTPWWASGRGPDEGLDADEDPVASHRRARRGDGDGRAERGAAGRREGSDSDGEPPDGDDARDWWEDTAEALAGAVREAARAGRSAGGQERVEAHEHGSGAPACRVCPICIALRALGEARPEVVAHLGEAARHVALALKAFADAQVAAAGGADRLERIDLDDD